MKILKIFLIYGGLLFLGDVSISLFFAYMFGGGNSPLLGVPFNLFFAWLAGYYAVKSFRNDKNTANAICSPFWQGASISLFAGLLGTLLLYVITGEFTFDYGWAIILIAGYGGKRAADNVSKPLNKIQTVLTWIILAIISAFTLLIVGNAILYRFTEIKIIKNQELNHYEDKKFGYTFDYSNKWKISRYPLAQGYVTFTSPTDEGSNVYFWYKDSGKINNIDDLLNFVKDDAKYGEENQGAKTLLIEKTSINKQNAIVWSSTYENGIYSKVYYFADFNSDPDQAIFIWVVVVNSKNKAEPVEKEVVQAMLNSFRIIK